MNIQKNRSRMIAAVATLAFMIGGVSSEAATRKRAVRLGQGAAATVSGRVTDATTGSPVVGAIVTLRGKQATTGNDGTFSFTGIASGSTTATVERFGYETVIRQVTISAGSSTFDVQLSASPSVTVSTSDGKTHRLVLSSVQFGFALGLIGYQSSANATVCDAAKTSRTLEKSQIASISGPPGTSACCPGGQQVRFTLKSGEVIDGTFLDSCAGYRMDLIGRQVSDGTNIYLSFTTIQSIQFP